MGRARYRGFLRISAIVSKPSISGIMMSINTTARSGVLSIISIAWRPFVALRISIDSPSSTLASA